jgi:hypothetical protein
MKLITIDNIYIKNTSTDNKLSTDINNIFLDILEDVINITELDINYINYISKNKILEKIKYYILASKEIKKINIKEYINYLIRIQDNINKKNKNNKDKEYKKLDFILLYRYTLTKYGYE